MITDVNVRVKLPSGEIVRANRQPASTGKLERAGIIGEANAHTFFLNGSLELNLSATLTVVARRQGRTLVDLPAAAYRVFDIKDVDAWDYHTEVLTVESATGATSDLTEAWTRTRRTRTGIKPDTKAPVYTTQTETVMLKTIRSSGDETSDDERTGAVVLGTAGSLEVGDVLKAANTYVVINLQTEGDFTRAELRLA